MRHSPRRGFTLIELLVVVAIIGLLIAILLPSLGKARASARRAVCASSLKEWGVVVNMYSQEWEGWFGSKIGGPTWAASPGLYQYQINALQRKMRTCPGDPSLPVGTTNYVFVRYLPYISSQTAWRMTDIKRPFEKMLMCDGYRNNGTNAGNIHGTTGGSGLDNHLVDMSTPPAFDTEVEIKDRHQGIGNVMFLDAHVEAHPWSDFVKNIPDQGWISGGNPPTVFDFLKKWTQMD